MFSLLSSKEASWLSLVAYFLEGPLRSFIERGDAGVRRIGVLDYPVPQGRRHSIRKSVAFPATKSPLGTKQRPENTIANSDCEVSYALAA
jgi:hypothetical protein